MHDDVVPSLAPTSRARTADAGLADDDPSWQHPTMGLPSLFRLVVVVLVSSGGRAMAAAPALVVEQVVVDGVVTDAVAFADGVLVSHVAKGERRLSTIDTGGTLRPGPAVQDGTVAVGTCGATSKLHFIDDRGLVDARGVVVIARPPLLSIPDAAALPIVSVCPTPRERILLVREGLAVATVDAAGAVVDEVVLPFAHRARAFTGGTARSLKGERPYAAALSLYEPWIFTIDADTDGDLDLVLVHEERVLIFRRDREGLLRGPAVERHLGELIAAPAGSDLRAHAVDGGLVVTASVGALPEQSVIATVVGAPERPLSKVARREVIDGLAIHLASSRAGVVVARVDTSLVSLSGVVLTGKVPLEVRRDGRAAMTLPTAADVRAGRVDGALPVVDVDLDGDGVVDLVELGEPGRAVLWRGGRDGAWSATSSSVAIPALDRAFGAPALGRVVLIGRGGARRTTVALLRATPG
jgi:hypothetical protein